MNIFRQIKTGLYSYKEAHDFIREHSLWGYVLLPGIINSFLLILMIISGWMISEPIMENVLEIAGIESSETDAFWVKFIYWLGRIILQVLLVMLYIMIYKYLVLLIMAPVLAFISEKVESLKTGRSFPFGWKQFMQDILRGVLIAVRNIFFELLITIPLLLLSFIPVINVVIPFLIYIVQSYFYGFSMMDYYNERHRKQIKESEKFIYQNKGIAVANGAGFLLLLWIPLIGLLIAPTYAIVAGTLSTLKAANEER